MTRDEKIQAFAMRLDGATYQEIGKKFGVSRQRIEQVINKKIQKPSRRFMGKGFLYPNLIKWMIENEISINELSKGIGLNRSATLTLKLKGKSDFKKNEIDIILAKTNMNYEECFKLEGISK